jgi:molybdenum cofactor cytidylyltransferase
MVKLANHVSTIVLAAGYSSRMGSTLKPLLKVGDYTIVERAVLSHREAGIQDVRVVVGYRADEVIESVKHLGIGIVKNRNFDKGMFSSVQAGVATLEPRVRAFFIMPVDIPFVEPATIRAILDAQESNCSGITYPVYQGRRGHPPLISTRYIPEIMEFPAPDGLRGILNSHDAEAREIDVDDEAVLLDIDTLEDYHRLRGFREILDIPNPEQCMKLFEEAGADKPVWNHCRMVAAIACHMARLLNNEGAGLNMKLVRAAALLHDIKRGEKDHAFSGALFLRTRGYARVADIVAAHMDMVSTDAVFPTEMEIIYLADKLVMGQRFVPLEERFAIALERFKGNDQVRMSILRRREQAEQIKRRVEIIIGTALEGLSSMNLPDPIAEFSDFP